MITEAPIDPTSESTPTVPVGEISLGRSLLLLFQASDPAFKNGCLIKDKGDNSSTITLSLRSLEECLNSATTAQNDSNPAKALFSALKEKILAKKQPASTLTSSKKRAFQILHWIYVGPFGGKLFAYFMDCLNNGDKKDKLAIAMFLDYLFGLKGDWGKIRGEGGLTEHLREQHHVDVLETLTDVMMNENEGSQPTRLTVIISDTSLAVMQNLVNRVVVKDIRTVETTPKPKVATPNSTARPKVLIEEIVTIQDAMVDKDSMALLKRICCAAIRCLRQLVQWHGSVFPLFKSTLEHSILLLSAGNTDGMTKDVAKIITDILESISRYCSSKNMTSDITKLMAKLKEVLNENAFPGSEHPQNSHTALRAALGTSLLISQRSTEDLATIWKDEALHAQIFEVISHAAQDTTLFPYAMTLLRAFMSQMPTDKLELLVDEFIIMVDSFDASENQAGTPALLKALDQSKVIIEAMAHFYVDYSMRIGTIAPALANMADGLVPKKGNELSKIRNRIGLVEQVLKTLGQAASAAGGTRLLRSKACKLFLPTFLPLLSSEDLEIRQAAARTFAYLDVGTVLPILVESLMDKSTTTRSVAIEAQKRLFLACLENANYSMDDVVVDMLDLARNAISLSTSNVRSISPTAPRSPADIGSVNKPKIDKSSPIDPDLFLIPLLTCLKETAVASALPSVTLLSSEVDSFSQSTPISNQMKTVFNRILHKVISKSYASPDDTFWVRFMNKFSQAFGLILDWIEVWRQLMSILTKSVAKNTEVNELDAKEKERAMLMQVSPLIIAKTFPPAAYNVLTLQENWADTNAANNKNPHDIPALLILHLVSKLEDIQESEQIRKLTSDLLGHLSADTFNTVLQTRLPPLLQSRNVRLLNIWVLTICTFITKLETEVDKTSDHPYENALKFILQSGMKILEWESSDDMPRLQNLHMGVLEVFGLMMSVLSVRMVTLDEHAIENVNNERKSPLISEIKDEEECDFLNASTGQISTQLNSILTTFTNIIAKCESDKSLPSSLPPTQQSMLLMNVFTTSFRQLQRRIMAESSSYTTIPVDAATWLSTRINSPIIHSLHKNLSTKSLSITTEIDTFCAAGYQTLLQSVYICKDLIPSRLWTDMVDIVVAGVSSPTTMSCLGSMKLLTGLLSCSEHVKKVDSLKLLQVRKALESIGVMDSRVECRKLAESLLSII